MRLKKRIAKMFLVMFIAVATIGTSIALPFILQATLAENAKAATYSISNEQQLKDWLQNTNSVQTNNPNAELTENITLSWGNTAPYGTIIENGSTLNGNNKTITLAGFAATTPGGQMYGQLGLFVGFINGTLQNTNFELNSDFDIRIHADTAQQNEQLYTGVLCGKMESGQVLNCSVNIQGSIWFNTNTKGFTNPSDSSSNHFGVIAGGMWGNALVSNVVVKQAQGKVLQVYADQGFSFLRIGMITADPFKNDSGVPTIKNVFIERSGEIKFKNKGWGAGGEIYGAVVADLDTGGSGANHQVNIDGVIYTSTIGADPGSGIRYNYRHERADNARGYLIGAMKYDTYNFTIQNIYSLIEFTDTAYVNSQTVGYTYLSPEYTYSFVGDQLQIAAVSPVENEFIWSITKNAAAQVFDVHTQVSSTVQMQKVNTGTDITKDTFSITKGYIKPNAVFGFAQNSVVYNGKPFETVQANIQGEIITGDFKLTYANNVHAFATTKQQASFTLTFDEREDGLFMPNHKYYIPKSGITYENKTMQIEAAPLKITFSGTHVFDNELVVQGLVNNEKVVIDGQEYGNGVFTFNCLSNSTQKQIEFVSCTQTDYAIEELGTESLSFAVMPYTIALTGNVGIVEDQPELFAVQDGYLQIYAKELTTLVMQQTFVVGSLHTYTLTTSSPENFTLTRKVADGTETITLTTNTDFSALQGIVLTDEPRQIAVRIGLQMPDGEVVTCVVNVNEDAVLYPMGNSLVHVSQYGDEVRIVVTLDEEFKDAYTLTYQRGEEQITSENGVLTITTNVAAGNTNIMDVQIVVQKNA